MNKDNRTCCSCLTVVYDPKEMSWNLIQPRWRCVSCGAEFQHKIDFEVQDKVEAPSRFKAILLNIKSLVYIFRRAKPSKMKPERPWMPPPVDYER